MNIFRISKLFSAGKPHGACSTVDFTADLSYYCFYLRSYRMCATLWYFFNELNLCCPTHKTNYNHLDSSNFIWLKITQTSLLWPKQTPHFCTRLGSCDNRPCWITFRALGSVTFAIQTSTIPSFGSKLVRQTKQGSVWPALIHLSAISRRLCVERFVKVRRSDLRSLDYVRATPAVHTATIQTCREPRVQYCRTAGRIAVTRDSSRPAIL